MPVTITRLRKLLDSIRSKPLDQGDIGESNWVARFAQWTERHYLLADILITVALIAMFSSATRNELRDDDGQQ